MTDCIFCKIVKKEIPSQIVYEDEKVIAFKDINALAPIHLLVVPKEHIKNIQEINEQNKDLFAHICVVAKNLAEEFGLGENGFRVVTNCGDDGGQTVFHLHFHVLGGQPLGSFA